jgi:dUTP pyrophosphatase
MVMDIRFKKLSEFATIPTKAHDDDLGLDLYASQHTVIDPGAAALVHTGIACQFPTRYITEGLMNSYWLSYGGILKDRSSIASKYNVYVHAGVIDPSYRGEIKVLMHNTGTDPFHVSMGMKIAQMVLVASPIVEILEVEELSDTKRGDKGFGSSDA